MIKKPQGTGSPNIDNFKGRREQHLEKNLVTQKNKNQNLEKILDESIKFLKSGTANKTDATAVAHFLMGRAEKLPAGVKLADASIPPELKSTLNNLLQTNRYGINPETSAKTIAKLEHLLSTINNKKSESVNSSKEKESSQQTASAQSENFLPEQNETKIQQTNVKSTDLSKTQKPESHQFTETEVNDWLFHGKSDSRLHNSPNLTRTKEKYAPLINFKDVPTFGEKKISSKIGMHFGDITELKAEGDQTARVGIAMRKNHYVHNGLPGAPSLIHAAGAGLQAEIFNTFSARATENDKKNDYLSHDYGAYGFECDSHEMKETHGIDKISAFVPPSDPEVGWSEFYYEMLENAKEDDFIALPIVFPGNELSVDGSKFQSTHKSDNLMEGIRKFYFDNPDSKLKIILVCPSIAGTENKSEIIWETYKDQIGYLDLLELQFDNERMLNSIDELAKSSKKQ